MLRNVCGGDYLRQYEISKVEEQDFDSMLVLESMQANLSLNRARMASIMVHGLCYEILLVSVCMYSSGMHIIAQSSFGFMQSGN
jgi:hypothetical protein